MPLHCLLNFAQLKYSTVVSNASPIMHMASLFLKVNQNITLCFLNFYFVILFTLSFSHKHLYWGMLLQKKHNQCMQHVWFAV